MTTNWREQQVQETRRQIVDTFLELSRRTDAGRVSTADVARASGISPATVYRHFPNRDALVSAAAMTDAAVGVDSDVEAWTVWHMVQHLHELWGRLVDDIAVVRAGAVSEAGLEMRVARFRSLEAHYAAALDRAGADPRSGEGRRALATLALLGSVHTLLDLHDRQGLTPAEAAEAAGWGMRAVLTAAGVDPDRFVLVDEPTDHPSNNKERP